MDGGRPGAGGLADLWSRLRQKDVFLAGPMRLGLAFLSRRRHLVDPGALRSLLERNLPVRRLERTAVPVYVVATEVTSGEEVPLSKGDLRTALLASTVIPGGFPPVRIGRRWLMDGGVADSTPISRAVELGAGRVNVLTSGYACALEQPPAGARAWSSTRSPW